MEEYALRRWAVYQEYQRKLDAIPVPIIDWPGIGFVEVTRRRE
jgi:hypothetical protein